MHNNLALSEPGRSWTGFLLRLAISVATLIVSMTQAATLVVTSTADSGPGTLREALAIAADGDTIDATGISGTILLTSGELLVSKSLSILGGGPDKLAVDGNAASRVLHICSNTIVNISGLTFTNGYKLFGPTNFGGGIYNNHATLTVSNCTLSGNTASVGGGIDNDGSFSGGGAVLRLVACRFTNNTAPNKGGGVHNDARFGRAQLIVLNCDFIANNAGNSGGGSGGALSSSAPSGSAAVAITNCTFNANRAPQAGGGIYNDGQLGNAALTVVNSTVSSNSVDFYGGGIASWGVNGIASLTVLNSTLTENTAGGNSGGGIVNHSGTLIVSHCSLVDNSAGSGDSIWCGGGLTHIGSSIMRGRSLPKNISAAGGDVVSDGYNLCNDNGSGFLTGTGDQINNTHLMLGPLQDNGGPTWTHALLVGSPAIDRGTNFTGAATDQRGQPRTYDFPDLSNAAGGDGTDIGAVEFILPALSIKSTPTNAVMVYWPSPSTGFNPQVNTNLDTTNWFTPPEVVQDNGTIRYIVVHPPTGNRFYRLKQP